MKAQPFVLPLDWREKYMAQLRTLRAELIKFLECCESKQATAEACKAARICAHNLHGSGNTFGFSQISETAHALEDALESNADQTSFIALTQAVIKACSEALQSFPESPTARKAPVLDFMLAPMPKVENKPLMLIAEDDVALSELLQGLFSRDAEIILAANGKQALDLIIKKKPAFVILDNNMPEMTGAEVLDKLAEMKDTPLPRIVMLTTNNSMADIAHGISAGIIDYITKPFDPARLANQVRRLLRNLKIKILIADDDAALRDLLFRKIRKLGFNVLQAEDGDQALKMAQEEKPQLIILDRMMPGMDGLAVLRKVREDEHLRETPVILLTAKRQNKDVVEGFEVGATDYVVKPFMPDEVVARVLRGLGLKEAS